MPISLACLIHWCQWWLECVGHSRKRRKKYFMYSHHLANCLPAPRTWIKTSWSNINLIVIFSLTGNTLHFSWVYLRLPRWRLIFHLTIPGLITFLPDNAVLIHLHSSVPFGTVLFSPLVLLAAVFPWSQEGKKHFVGRVWKSTEVCPTSYFCFPIHEWVFTGAASGKGRSTPAPLFARVSFLSLQASTVTCRALVPGIPPTSITWDFFVLICLFFSTISHSLIANIEMCLLLIFWGKLTQQQQNWSNLNCSPVLEALLVILLNLIHHCATPRHCPVSAHHEESGFPDDRNDFFISV